MIGGVLSLPQPDDLSSLVLRTDFTDDAAWAELQTVTGAEGATYVNDTRYFGVTMQALIDAAAADGDKLTYLFTADATTMGDPERTLLAVDLFRRARSDVPTADPMVCRCFGQPQHRKHGP